MAKRGPKPKYTPELISQIAEYRAKGLSRATISKVLKIPDSTLESWERIKDFRDKYCARRLKIAAEQIDKVLNDPGLGANGAKWWLERNFKDDFSPPVQTISQDINMAGKKAADLTDDQLAAIVDGAKPSKAKKLAQDAPEAHEITPEEQEREGRVVH